MPSPYIIRDYKIGGFYRVFNGGVNNCRLFIDEEDYQTFEHYLFVYLAKPQIIARRYPNLPANLRKANLRDDVELLCYGLHAQSFNLLVRLHWMSGVTDLLKQLANAYTAYFNQKYGRRGPLFNGPYKAMELYDAKQALEASFSIHYPATTSNVAEGASLGCSSRHDYERNRFRPFVSRALLEELKINANDYQRLRNMTDIEQASSIVMLDMV